MRKTTKVLLGSAAVLATAALVQVATPATADAAAAAIGDDKITVDAVTQTVTIDKAVLGDGNNRQIYFGIPKVSVRNGKGTVTTAAKWDVYDTTTNSNDLTISLASLKNTVDNYIQIKGSKEEAPVTILIPKAEKYRAEFNPVAAGSPTDKFFKVTKAKKESGAYPEVTSGIDVKVRTQFGDWQDLALSNDNPFAKYQEQGATLYFKVAASGDSAIEGLPSGSTEYVDKKKDTDGNDIPVTVKSAKSFASAEFKVSIKKRPDASKVKVDFVNGSYTLPKGYVDRVTEMTALGEGNFSTTPATENTKKDITLDSGLSAMIEQKQAKDASKKKMESKVAQLEVKRAVTPDLGSITIANDNDCLDKTIGAVKIGKVDAKKKLTIENTSDTVVYQVLLESSSTAKWKDIPVQKTKNSTVTPGKVTLTLTDTATPLSIRVKGDAKTFTLSSNALSLGQVKYDKAAVANTKIAAAVTELTKADTEDDTKSAAVKVESGNKKLKLPTISGVTVEWVSVDNAFIDNGKLKDTIASDAFAESSDTATANLKVKVNATDGTAKYVYFVVTVKKTVDGDNTTYAITKVAPGTETDPSASAS